MKTTYIITIIIACGSMALLPSHAQKVVVRGGYAAISAEGYTQGVLRDASTIFEDIPLGSLATTATKVDRQKRHTRKENIHISPLFAIAPTGIDVKGAAVLDKTRMTWSEAGGWGINVNTVIGGNQFALETGCPMYKGKDGKDNSGRWRLPTNKELHLMNLLKTATENTIGVTGFQPYFTGDNHHYWSSTEDKDWKVIACAILFTGTAGSALANKGTDNLLVRCVKDLPVVP